MDVQTIQALGPFITKAMAYFGAAIAILGGLGAGIGQGLTGAEAVKAVVRQPEARGDIITVLLIADAITESTGIYALVIAIILVFVAR